MRRNFGYRKDANHDEIVKALERLGWTFQCTASVGGFFDGVAVKYGTNVIIEIKPPGKDMDDDQRPLWEAWPGPKFILRTDEDCRKMDREIRSWRDGE